MPGRALKFYAGDDLPPASALFTEGGRRVFAEHPEKFARQRLCDMQAKLPALPSIRRRCVNRDDWVATKKWWRYEENEEMF